MNFEGLSLSVALQGPRSNRPSIVHPLTFLTPDSRESFRFQPLRRGLIEKSNVIERAPLPSNSIAYLGAADPLCL